MRLLGSITLPKDPEVALAYLNSALEEAQTALLELQESFFKVTYVAPARPVELMIRFADGTEWNPGLGRGLYQYVSAGWKKLGHEYTDLWNR